MPQRSIDFGPAIRDEGAERMRPETKYNIWISNGYSLVPGHVVGVHERADSVVVAIGRSSAQVPAFVLETATEDHDVAVHTPTFTDDGKTVTIFERIGTVDELQPEGNAWNESYPSAETFDQWLDSNELPA